MEEAAKAFDEKMSADYGKTSSIKKSSLSKSELGKLPVELSHHPKATETVRNNLSGSSAILQVENKLRETDESNTIKEYKDKIILNYNGGGNNSGYNVYDVQLDKDKLSRDEMGVEELKTIFSGSYNGDFSYNSVTGHLHFSMDSGD